MNEWLESRYLGCCEIVYCLLQLTRNSNFEQSIFHSSLKHSNIWRNNRSQKNYGRIRRITAESVFFKKRRLMYQMIIAANPSLNIRSERIKLVFRIFKILRTQHFKAGNRYIQMESLLEIYSSTLNSHLFAEIANERSHIWFDLDSKCTERCPRPKSTDLTDFALFVSVCWAHRSSSCGLQT